MSGAGGFVAGVSNDGLKSLCLEVLEYEEKIKNVLQSITDSYTLASNYLSGDLKAELDAKYNSLKRNYPTILANIDSYIDEFNALAAKEEGFDLQASLIVNAASNSIE